MSVDSKDDYEPTKMGTVDDLFTLMDIAKSWKAYGSMFVTSAVNGMLGASNPNAMDILQVNSELKDWAEQFKEEMLEAFCSEELVTQIIADAKKYFMLAYSPEQIDTLYNFYKANPWAFEVNQRMAKILSGDTQKLNSVLANSNIHEIVERYTSKLCTILENDSGDGFLS